MIIINNVFVCRNAPIGCDHHDVFDPSAWRETTKETIKTMISIEMLQEAIRKAEDNVLRRQQTEFLLWSHSKSLLHDCKKTEIIIFQI